MKTLKELLGDELYLQVEGALKDVSDVHILVDSKEKPIYIPKERFDQVNSEKKEYKKQIDQNVKDLETLKGQATDNAELVKTIDTLKKASVDYDVKLKGAKIDASLKVALIKMKAKNPALIEKLFDKSAITFVNDDVAGVEEQLNAIKKTDAYLFEADVPPVVIPPVIVPPVPEGGTKVPIVTPPGTPGGKPESIGAILAKKKAALESNAATNSFFKTEQ